VVATCSAREATEYDVLPQWREALTWDSTYRSASRCDEESGSLFALGVLARRLHLR
jgi:hypothetical protein